MAASIPKPSSLSLRQLSFAFGARRVLHDITLDFGPGRLVGLVGPNGAGKTTLLKLAAGLLVPAAGEVLYDGHSLAHLSVRARAPLRAYVAQGLGEPFPYQVDEMVAMGQAFASRTYSAPQPGEAVHAALAEVGFLGDPARRFDELSGGERQLVVLARALVQGARVLILDEATSHLDLKHKSALVAALKRRARQGVLVLWSVHDLGLAALACDEVVVLKDGGVVAAGSPRQALDAATVARVYEVPVLVGTHAGHGAPTVELDPAAWA